MLGRSWFFPPEKVPISFRSQLGLCRVSWKFSRYGVFGYVGKGLGTAGLTVVLQAKSLLWGRALCRRCFYFVL
jgi:hypothetical protein